MEVILINGAELEISIKATRLYKEITGKDWYLYEWVDDETKHGNYIFISDDRNIDDGGSTLYRICDVYLGEKIDRETLLNHVVDEPFSRTDPVLITILKELGREALSYCDIYIADVPDGIIWHIDRMGESLKEFVVEGPPAYPRTWIGTSIDELRRGGK